jgi:hypothetical protein
VKIRSSRLVSTNPAGRAALAILAVVLASGPARAADLYGKPLRGLSPVAVREVVQNPARFAAKATRVEGPNAGEPGSPALKDGDAVLPIVTNGSFKFPADMAGGILAAEGRARGEGKSAVFVATGVEVRREATR